MKLSSKAIESVKKDKGARNRLASELNKTDFTIIRWLKENSDNGPLTMARVLQIIKEETELPEDEILEPSEAAA